LLFRDNPAHTFSTANRCPGVARGGGEAEMFVEAPGVFVSCRHGQGASQPGRPPAMCAASQAVISPCLHSRYFRGLAAARLILESFRPSKFAATFARMASPGQSATRLRSRLSSRRPSTPRWCSPFFVNCRRRERNGNHPHNREQAWPQDGGLAARCRAR
jgi:hypothetical protein